MIRLRNFHDAQRRTATDRARQWRAYARGWRVDGDPAAADRAATYAAECLAEADDSRCRAVAEDARYRARYPEAYDVAVAEARWVNRIAPNGRPSPRVLG